MTTYAKRKLKYLRNENFNLLHYVEWDRFINLAGNKSGLRVTLSYLQAMKKLCLEGPCAVSLVKSCIPHI